MSAEALLALAQKARTLVLTIGRAEASCALGPELTPASAALLEILRQHGPLTAPKLARASGSSRQNVQLIINRLKKAGLVEFEPNAAHKRSPLLRLTGDGLKQCEALRSARDALLTKVASAFSGGELRNAAAALEKINEVLVANLPASAKRWPSRPVTSGSQKARLLELEEEIPLSLL